MFVPVGDVNVQELKGFSLILPAISVGQAGQLATDLLIENIEGVKQIGYIHDDAVIPMVCPDPFYRQIKKKKKIIAHKPTDICTSLTVFASLSSKLILIQQRSNFIKGRIPAYRRRLREWIKSIDVNEVMVLSSCSSHICRDKDLSSLQTPRFLLSRCAEQRLKESYINTFKWMEFEKKPKQEVEHEPANQETITSDYLMPGAGITKYLFKELSDDEIVCTCLVVFSNEGNSVNESITLAKAAIQKFSNAKIRNEQLKYPSSWEWMSPPSQLPSAIF